MKTDRFTGGLKRFYKEESGITGLETAIILIAFIVVAAVFAFTIMTTGLFSTEKAKTTAQAGIGEASSTFAPKGGIVAKSNGGKTAVTSIIFQLTLASGAEQASIDKDSLAFIYTDDNQMHSTKGTIADTNKGIIKSVAVSKIVGGAPADLLKSGEVAEIVITLNHTGPNVVKKLEEKSVFRIEVIPPAGGSLIIERKTPPALQAVMNLE